MKLVLSEKHNGIVIVALNLRNAVEGDSLSKVLAWEFDHPVGDRPLNKTSTLRVDFKGSFPSLTSVRRSRSDIIEWLRHIHLHLVASAALKINCVF